MSEKDSEKECICRNIRKEDAICIFNPGEKKPAAVFHKDCPVHPIILKRGPWKRTSDTPDPKISRMS